MEQRMNYKEKKTMETYVNKYKKLIEDELFKATPDEAIEFCRKLENYLEYYIDQMEKEKEQYK